MKGQIVRYFKEKGFGFISTENGDVFFHITGLADNEAVDVLDDVDFDVEETDRGQKAINIKRVE